ncbi:MULTISPECIES: TetR/AcrR family transcriptional regulator [unclassified Acinetobacter]|uniref:TetR/AcrR family transcriptional regulator n=1 Tax=unclassified Acinetobacter TaxID=196816 RepID=UPI0012191DBB|nr:MULTISPECIES: TetR/AcrR family transcriptional regulator [unclassified Acinetobacter]RZJ22049.1 MAG: TetR/AcrR family transcriptional regulator [Acinetobacter sp.]
MQELAQLDSLARDTPQTKRGHERCLALLLSANELFLKHGYDAVSLDDIVNHAGGSKASIYKFFGNKEGLFTAICDYRREQFFKDICLPFEQGKENFKSYLINTLINFHRHLLIPENAAFMRLILERTQHNPELALYIHEQGPKHIQSAIACALEKAHSKGILRCEHPLYSAQFYFGILRNLEWRILMNIPAQENDQETIEYITYCVDRFLEGHQPR